MAAPASVAVDAKGMCMYVHSTETISCQQCTMLLTLPHISEATFVVAKVAGACAKRCQAAMSGVLIPCSITAALAEQQVQGQCTSNSQPCACAATKQALLRDAGSAQYLASQLRPLLNQHFKWAQLDRIRGGGVLVYVCHVHLEVTPTVMG
jgi:hypothetical protein